MTRLFLDDERPAPEGWERVLTAEDCIEHLRRGDICEVSLDHDLGTDTTGYDVLCWIESETAHGWVPPTIRIHTANPSARVKMQLAVESIERLVNRRP